jgi:hypothetical protein
LIMKASFIGLCIYIIIMLQTDVCFAVIVAPSCSFTQTTATLSFGNLNPLSAANATSIVTLGISCSGDTTWHLTSDNGLYYNGATKRMRHEKISTEYLPYTVTFGPTTGNNSITTITGSGIILNSSYINAYVGYYSDHITLTITP